MTSAEIYKPQFTKITDGHAGAEGPVFNSSGSRFYMVAPEVEVEGKPAGQVLAVDTVLNKVWPYTCPLIAILLFFHTIVCLEK